MKLIYAAQFEDSSGYASAARGYLRAIDSVLSLHSDIEFKIFPLSVEHSSKLSDFDLSLIKKYQFNLFEEIDTFTQEPYCIVWHQPPVMPELGSRNYWGRGEHWKLLQSLIKKAAVNINCTVWEADNLPPYFEREYDRYGTYATIVPSLWNKEIFSKYTTPSCFLIPHVIEELNLEPNSIKFPTSLKDKFVIFSMSQWNSRKGFDKLVQAFTMEFGNNEDVLLLIKTYISVVKGDNSTTEQQAQHIGKEIKLWKNLVYFDESAKAIENNIIIIPDIISDNKIKWLYQNSNVFALLTRGEGFGLTLAEAAINELPIITTKEGGHRDFIRNDFLVEGHWSPYLGKPEYSCDMNWYEPHLNSARLQLRQAYTLWKEKPQVLKQYGQWAKKAIHPETYGREAVGTQFLTTCKNVFDNNKKLSIETAKTTTLSDIKYKIKQLKFSLAKETNLDSKVDLLKNSFKNRECVVLSCGPSLNDYSTEELRTLLQNKIVLAVKQAYNKIPDLVDFHFWNCSNLPQLNENEVHYDYSKSDNPPIVIASSNYDKGLRWSIKQYDDLFFKIPIRTSIGNDFLCKTFDFDRWTFKSSLTRPCGPGIMFETVLFVALHLGINKITTLGWDLEDPNPQKLEDHKHFFGTTKNLINRGDILQWEIEANRQAVSKFYDYLSSNNVKLEIASKNCSFDVKIPRVKL